MTEETRTGLTAEVLAKMFHARYEELAPMFGYATRKESAVPWEQVPENNRRLMTAVCESMLATLAAAPALSPGAPPAIDEIGLGDVAWGIAKQAVVEKWSDLKLAQSISHFAKQYGNERHAALLQALRELRDEWGGYSRDDLMYDENHSIEKASQVRAGMDADALDVLCQKFQ